MTAYTAGWFVPYLVWTDIDGNQIRWDTLTGCVAVDASPVAVTDYRKAPAHAVAAIFYFSGAGGANTTYFSDVVFRRCPLRLIVVAEDAAGALTSYKHPVHLTVKYTPKYEIAR
jgi:hypothetical protein